MAFVKRFSFASFGSLKQSNRIHITQPSDSGVFDCYLFGPFFRVRAQYDENQNEYELKQRQSQLFPFIFHIFSLTSSCV